MINRYLSDALSQLSTPLIADACLRLGVSPYLAPPGIRSLMPGGRVASRVLPAQHYGSVDIFLEAMGTAEQGDVLVVRSFRPDTWPFANMRIVRYNEKTVHLRSTIK
jgi:hypothetical protein